ncbi:MAG: helix-turn-helix transcriptional regulator [Treponema sp.]|nr:helix-turn-helix transcriptional regulator [Treponema sp.]
MLSNQIKTLRQNAGISQIELAAELGVTKQSISNWENDNIMPSIDMLIKIAKFFSVSTDFLLGLSVEHTLKTDGLSKKQIAHIQALISDLQNLEH